MNLTGKEIGLTEERRRIGRRGAGAGRELEEEGGGGSLTNAL